MAIQPRFGPGSSQILRQTWGGWREAPQDHRVGIVDVTQLSDDELESMIAEHLAVVRNTASTANHLLIEGR